MFTGIVQGIASVVELTMDAGNLHYAISLPLALQDTLVLGASVSVDGVCQTVTAFEQDRGIVTFTAIKETLDKTTLKDLKLGQAVNVERSLCFGQEVGGHILSGHVMATGCIAKINHAPGAYVWRIEHPQVLSKYLVPKGYVGLDGASLTLVDVGVGYFTVSLIPHTLEVTTFKDKQAGDSLNIEIDSNTQLIVETVERYMNNMKMHQGG